MTLEALLLALRNIILQDPAAAQKELQDIPAFDALIAEDRRWCIQPKWHTYVDDGTAATCKVCGGWPDDPAHNRFPPVRTPHCGCKSYGKARAPK